MQIDHANVLKLYDSYQDKKRIYLVFEYVRGANLVQFIKAVGTFKEKEIVDIMFPILKAVNYLHQNHIFHSNIKAENIFLERKKDNDFLLKITNFNSGKMLDEDDDE